MIEYAFQIAGVKSDRAKKTYVTWFIVDRNVVEQWKGLKEYASGTFEEFKNAVQVLYPEIERQLQGDKEWLNMIYARYRNLEIHDAERVNALGMAIITEAKKIVKKGQELGRALITDSDIITGFMGCLSPSLALALHL